MTIDITHLQSLFIICGISGAGKSKSLDALSDFGFFTVENLPVSIIEEFIKNSKNDPARFSRLAILPDIASEEHLNKLLILIDSCLGCTKIKLIYVDCANDIIVRRYSESRRPHPSFDVQKDKTLEDAINRERSRLAIFRDRASLLLETSNWNIHELRRALLAFVESISFTNSQEFRLNFLSFGFKYGLPSDCDIVMDARFLPNPYFQPNLRDKDGLDSSVADYVLGSDECKQFLAYYEQLLRFSLPLYIDSGKQYLNVGIGCTGGKHRSVAIAQALTSRFDEPSLKVSAKHRDKDR